MPTPTITGGHDRPRWPKLTSVSTKKRLMPGIPSPGRGGRAAWTASIVALPHRPQDEEASCEPPLEIQVQPLCVHLEVVAADPVWERRSVRSAPVGRIDHAPVLLSRTVQVKVYTDSLAVAWRVLAALRSANGVAPVLGERDPIPASPAAVLRGTHACQ